MSSGPETSARADAKGKVSYHRPSAGGPFYTQTAMLVQVAREMFDTERKVSLERKSLLFSTFRSRGRHCEEAIKLLFSTALWAKRRVCLGPHPAAEEDHTDRLPDALRLSKRPPNRKQRPDTTETSRIGSQSQNF